ncbi:3-hydroxybutyryl-CoA dehydrogenase [Micromonospora aurantiaca]|uniref:3-hydroxyacyl-CoA dehydrogenase family protein n=1 Tax=Micromonospora aurantiaca (nom. illeg.) TaxID=47850 RepID=A0ABQ6UDA4_9ACTN|nr:MULTISPECIES: 3-hydroxybutyryl-CoA dehydrogenase [Micromonospora]ADU08718.1 3-hydroxyacyl-CoA dehydrogenase NAD-binding protein [Micromonospora sp. L5]KAB1108579.1 3-hydroxyacyl-CoA dehydrogenase family protein [Micromonospora aurantiaca]RNH97496.1 3-hydroxyacyl-CoA dehydrogenase family protein [Micromonospora aurantiaca]UFN93605.1 NAD(P)-binding domain-containing protein [Micromonospora aurantiaca]WBC02024.1 3-hydroxybutyryl-CoA dehydrogenase [Micromonospora sp. WMMA1976]
MAREFTRVGVVGLGTMGAGIVEVFARNGVDVTAVEISDAALERGRATLTGSTDRAVAKGKLAEAERDALLARVDFRVGLDALHDVDLVIEAVPEHLDLKQRIFAELDRVCKPEAILATNTSSLSVTEISVATTRPNQVIGIHFFNPAPVMKLVEVVRTVVTSADVVADVEALCERLGKVDVTISDRAGFIANALLFGYLNHAVGMFEARYATREDIDAAMKLGCGLPMGPLALMDLIGLDTAYEILDTMYRRGGRDRRHAPAPLLKQMVTAGLLGRKSGRGFYTYERPGSPKVVPDEYTPLAADAALADGARAIAKVGVVGSGTMATGIIEVFAKAGYEVISVTRGAEKSAKVCEAVKTSLNKGVVRGKLSETDRDDALGRITWSATLEHLADVDLVVEAVIEELSVKKALFASLDEICKPGVVLATTTSSLPVIDVAMATQRPADVVGLHFFNPAPIMPLVEIVQTIRTSAETSATARAVCAKLGKTGVVCGDRSGFIVNALLFPYLNDAVKMLEASYSTADDIDYAMKLGCGYPMGPFELLDVVGLDVSLAIQRELYLELREPGFAPAPLLEHLVTAGYLGRKSGRGFRDHTRR